MVVKRWLFSVSELGRSDKHGAQNSTQLKCPTVGFTKSTTVVGAKISNWLGTINRNQTYIED
jgi:hypothetical protein